MNKTAADIIDAIAHLQRAFAMIGLEPPAALLLASHSDGIRVALELAQLAHIISRPGDARLGTPVEMADGSIFMEIEINGLKVRWPATTTVMPDGSWRFS